MKRNLHIKPLLFYLGCIPFFPSLLSLKKNNIEHQKQYFEALAVSFIQILTFFITLFLWAFGYFAVAELLPHSLETFTLYHIFIPGYFLGLILFSGVLLWFLYLIITLFNLKIQLKLIAKLVKNKIILWISYLLNTALFVFLCFILFWIFDANRLSEEVKKPVKVFMLYDDMGFVPHWVFPFGFYQIQKAAIKKWHQGAVSIEPITNESLIEALHHSEMIFLSVHGDFSFGEYAGLFHFMNKDRTKFYAYGPKEIEKLGIGSHLKYVYLAQCNGGSKHEEWHNVFSPAKIKTYNRISTYPEHIFWLWYKLPRILYHDL